MEISGAGMGSGHVQFILELPDINLVQYLMAINKGCKFPDQCLMRLQDFLFPLQGNKRFKFIF